MSSSKRKQLRNRTKSGLKSRAGIQRHPGPTPEALARRAEAVGENGNGLEAAVVIDRMLFLERITPDQHRAGVLYRRLCGEEARSHAAPRVAVSRATSAMPPDTSSTGAKRPVPLSMEDIERLDMLRREARRAADALVSVPAERAALDALAHDDWPDRIEPARSALSRLAQAWLRSAPVRAWIER